LVSRSGVLEVASFDNKEVHLVVVEKLGRVSVMTKDDPAWRGRDVRVNQLTRATDDKAVIKLGPRRAHHFVPTIYRSVRLEPR
jgi:hypothetical protein